MLTDSFRKSTGNPNVKFLLDALQTRDRTKDDCQVSPQDELLKRFDVARVEIERLNFERLSLKCFLFLGKFI